MNQQFQDRMKTLLKDEYDDYIDSFQKVRYQGIRKNLLKDSGNLLTTTFKLKHTPFCEEGYYTLETISGNHPFHKMGLFYMQEPSATAVVTVLDPQIDDWVLDLCAAPGGKSTQIASKLQNTGFLVSNEFIQKRAVILMSNLERMGVSEAMVVNATTRVLCKEMMGCFDRVVVDAPCSGEGMFKKHDKAMQEWSLANVEACAKRQLEILEDAYIALKKDGILVYSTCTYAIEENEEVIYQFLSQHQDMELLDCGVSFGRSGVPYKDMEVSKLRRIFPMDGGEGHFIAKLKKTGEQTKASLSYYKDRKLDVSIKSFLMDQLSDITGYYYEQNQKLYKKDTPFIQLKKVHVLRQGMECGEMIKGRFEPHHHFYMSAKHLPLLKYKVILDEEEVKIYLQGNVLNKVVDKGYVALMYKGFVIGFGKSDGKQIKNKYPKGLRVV